MSRRSAATSSLSPATRCARPPASARSTGARELLDAMPPWHGGGEMIVSVSLETSSYKTAPHRFEAGTPNIAGAVGLGAADRLPRGDRPRAHLRARSASSRPTPSSGSRNCPACASSGRAERAAASSDSSWKAAHPHDLTTYADQYGLALRGGHHCNQPLMRKFGLPGTTRASFYFYNTPAEVDRMIEILDAARRFFT